MWLTVHTLGRVHVVYTEQIKKTQSRTEEVCGGLWLNAERVSRGMRTFQGGFCKLYVGGSESEDVECT